VAFYETVLGLERTATYERAPGAELTVGNLTLVAIDCEAQAIDFEPNTHPVALQVDDFAAACAALEAWGVAFKHVLDSGASRRFSTIPTATRCCSISATPPTTERILARPARLRAFSSAAVTSR
jgi:hypothetical protein